MPVCPTCGLVDGGHGEACRRCETSLVYLQVLEQAAQATLDASYAALRRGDYTTAQACVQRARTLHHTPQVKRAERLLTLLQQAPLG